MIYQRYDCVVYGEMIGRVSQIHYNGSRRVYLVQFGAAGPFIYLEEKDLRPASVNEEKFLDGRLA